ncbi:adenylate kinase [Candidatus Woesearchaeota archaeon]|nr:adenylate kinase [Candidatus Woesearchaeota archaeon]
MRIIIFGPPGAGKGTISASLIKRFGIPQVSTGDLLRESIRKMDDIGRKAKPFMDEGQLVPDEIVIALLSGRLHQPDALQGFILDGFPRTLNQAEELKQFAGIEHVLNLKSSRQVIMKRLSGRRTCSKCNAIYHITNLPPKKEGICDKCGGALFQRNDDNPKTIAKRLKAYRLQTMPLIKYYRKEGILKDIDGEQQSIQKIVDDCIKAIENG